MNYIPMGNFISIENIDHFFSRKAIIYSVDLLIVMYFIEMNSGRFSSLEIHQGIMIYVLVVTQWRRHVNTIRLNFSFLNRTDRFIKFPGQSINHHGNRNEMN